MSVLEVVLSLPSSLSSGRLAYAQLLLSGDGLARDFGSVDASLRRRATTAFSLAGLAMCVVIATAFFGLERANQRLLRANRELGLAARTSAVGAVAAHLVHGIKNPLTGLQHFVADAGATIRPEDWADAAEAARRMKALVDEVTRVLRDEAGLDDFEIGCEELLEATAARLTPFCRVRGIVITAESSTNRTLPGRTANLVLLAVENLGNNAVQASPVGGTIRLTATETARGLELRVADDGPGLPEEVLARLFSPKPSSKPGSGGLGLPISRQLALSLGGDIELESSGAHGATFCLWFPIPPRFGL